MLLRCSCCNQLLLGIGYAIRNFLLYGASRPHRRRPGAGATIYPHH